jgi:sugar phosphate isomerase/epimerase
MRTVFFYFLSIGIFISCNPGTENRNHEGASDNLPPEAANRLEDSADITDMDNLLAWCIVPFDSVHRNPSERISMLKDLGFKSYAYDWRNEHLAEMESEFRLAAENGIEIKAVWLWIDANTDAPGELSPANEKMLSIVEDAGLRTQIWTGFHPNFFGGLSEADAVSKGVEMVDYLAERSAEIGCSVALYNHGDWFGDPENQVKIIQGIPDRAVGIIYNFHHAHDQLDRLPAIIEAMKPYLWVVNLNGMRVEGPKILPIGSGDREKELIDMFLEAGFTGPFGILGHIEDADVKIILENNLQGLKDLFN